MSVALKYARPSYMPKLHPVPSSCVLCLEGQQDAYSSTIRDISGYGNHGTITNATWERNAQGVWVNSFDGDDYIQIPAPATQFDFTSENFTILMMAKISTFAAAHRPICHGVFNTSGYLVYISTDASLALFTSQAGANQVTSSTTGGLLVNTWHGLGISRQGATVKLYVNGLEDNPAAGTHINPVSANKPFLVGVDDDKVTEYFKGKIALLTVLSGKAFSGAEQANWFNGVRHLFGV